MLHQIKKPFLMYWQAHFALLTSSLSYHAIADEMTPSAMKIYFI